MFLKEIELENFKSFGKHLRLPLLQGYTAITGPNGSGKSNLSDAVLFVLGPRSSKVIRAGRLTDLVYNGGEEGSPAKHCRVSLILDNSDRTIPLDADEVRLTRHVGLSSSVEGGYNSYFYVNGRKATLSDFDSLLAHAKISADGYNIVQQGDVSKTVDMSPVERRKVLEDMAGISRFDEDIGKAEEERRGVEENLDRIDIILGEIRRQLQQLEKDRQAALRFRELKEELERARAQQALKDVQILQQQLTTAHKQVEGYEANREELRAERESLRGELEEAEERLGELEEEVTQQGGDDFQELKERLDALRIERARAQDGIEGARDEVKGLRSESLALKRELDKIAKAMEGVEAEGRKEERLIEEVQASIESKDGEIKELEGKAAGSDAKIVELQKDLVSLDREVEEVEGRRRSLELEREKSRQALENLEEQIGEMKEERKGKEFEVQDAEWQLKEVKSESKKVASELRSLTRRHGELEAEQSQLSKQSSELEAAMKSLSREYSQLKAELEAADKVRKGYNRAVGAILEARETGTLEGVHGTIAELAHVKPRYEVALNVAAGARMQAIVVEDDEVASQAIQMLKSQQLGRAIFLPLNKMLPGRPRGKALLAVKEALGFALDLVSFKEEYRNAFWYVFGDTVVVENLAQARRLMGGVRLVTLDGQLIEASGAIIGGQVGQPHLRFGQAAQGRLTEVGSKLRKASEELAKVNGRLQELRDEVGPLEKDIRELQGDQDRRATKAEILGSRLKELKTRLDRVVKSLQQREANKEETLQSIEATQSKVDEIGVRLENLKRLREAKRGELTEVTPQHIARKLRNSQSEKVSLLEELSRAKSRRETLGSKVALHQDRTREVGERLEDVRSRITLRDEAKEAMVKKLSKVEEELLGLRKMEERLLAEMKDVRERRDKAFKRRTQLEAKLEKVTSKLETTEDFLLSLEAQVASLMEKLSDAESRARECGHVEGDLPPFEEIKATIERCERALDSFEAVNLRALEDYEAQQARHEELKEELSRLKRERKNLLRLVSELEAKKREGLLQVFRSIRDNFVVIFGNLSEGGEAELLLENEEDPFAGGLIVKARPPNKRFLRLEALSGGEKSLVSMAFIFALQEYDPSPFYLLDEVDQNLDAINAERIARMIRHNSATAQFIQISLRKVSLKEADHIIGVTMGKRGTSEVVMKVDLEKVVEEMPKAEAMT